MEKCVYPDYLILLLPNVTNEIKRYFSVFPQNLPLALPCTWSLPDRYHAAHTWATFFLG